MSRQLSARRPATRRSSRLTPAVRPRLGSDEELDLAGPSGLSLPRVEPPAPGDSDWDQDVFEDSDDDSDYVQRPGDLSSSDEEPEEELDYVAPHDDSTDSDVPLSRRIFQRAELNAPGTTDYKWKSSSNAVRRHDFEGMYYSLLLYSFCEYLREYIVSISFCINLSIYISNNLFFYQFYRCARRQA